MSEPAYNEWGLEIETKAPKAPAPRPVPQACPRCGGSGLIVWDGKYVPKSFSDKPIMGPCIRCRPADFCEKIGLKSAAKQIRRLGYYRGTGG